MSGYCAGYEGEWSKPCPGKVTRFYMEPQKKRGQPTHRVVILEDAECNCKCHNPEVKAKPKPRARKRKS